MESGSFLYWLRSTAVSGFGQVEEVHAHDPSEKDELPLTAHSAIKEEYAPETEDKTSLIDRFIATEPRIVPSKAEFYSPATQAKKSITENEDLVSETLARIYHQQGNLLKARSCYLKLSLLHPEKSAYFATLITSLEGSSPTD